MTEAVQSSEAMPMAQEQGGDKPTGLPTAPSETSGGAQEQQHQAISQEEERRRLEQSIRDKVRHEERLRLEREMAERQRREQMEKERQALAAMDDEDYGRTMRQKQAALEQQQQAYQIARQMFESSFEVMQSDAVAAIKDPTIRSEFEKRVAANEFATFKDFTDALVEAGGQERAQAIVKRREKEIREATLNELRAQELGAIIPQLGNGAPTPTLNPDKVPTFKKLELGAAQAFKRKPGG